MTRDEFLVKMELCFPDAIGCIGEITIIDIELAKNFVKSRLKCGLDVDAYVCITAYYILCQKTYNPEQSVNEVRKLVELKMANDGILKSYGISQCCRPCSEPYTGVTEASVVQLIKEHTFNSEELIQLIKDNSITEEAVIQLIEAHPSLTEEEIVELIKKHSAHKLQRVKVRNDVSFGRKLIPTMTQTVAFRPSLTAGDWQIDPIGSDITDISEFIGYSTNGLFEPAGDGDVVHWKVQLLLVNDKANDIEASFGLELRNTWRSEYITSTRAIKVGVGLSSTRLMFEFTTLSKDDKEKYYRLVLINGSKQIDDYYVQFIERY